MQSEHLPKIILSGASGFVGRHLLQVLQDEYYIYALARRSQKAAGISPHPHIIWIRIDISDAKKVKQILGDIAKNGGADYFFHFAAHYDFRNKNDPEYLSTNIEGTRNLLENAHNLNLKRFIFASSLTVTEFDDPSVILNEKSPADAKFPYAVSKAIGEDWVKKFSSKFPCAIVRQAAIYSDWCEYLPLYSFITSWLSGRWNCRILAGKGNSAVPYLHIRDLNRFFLSIMKKSANLGNCEVLIASPDESTSHKDLFTLVTAYSYFGKIRPIFIPKLFAYFGVHFCSFIDIIFRKIRFERPWMIKYVDLEMKVDTSYTKELLHWQPTKRYDIKRRLLFLIGNMKSNPFRWHLKNELVPRFAQTEREDLKIYDAMLQNKEEIIGRIFEKIVSQENANKFKNYQKLDIDQLLFRLEYLYKVLEIDVRTGDRTNILKYGQNLAEERYLEGFPADEVIQALKVTADTIVHSLLKLPELDSMEKRIHHEIMVSLQMVIDIIEETYEMMKSKVEIVSEKR